MDYSKRNDIGYRASCEKCFSTCFIGDPDIYLLLYIDGRIGKCHEPTKNSDQ